MICLVEIAHMVIEKKMKKRYDNNNDDNDDDEGQQKKIDQKSSLEPWAEVMSHPVLHHNNNTVIWCQIISPTTQQQHGQLMSRPVY